MKDRQEDLRMADRQTDRHVLPLWPSASSPDSVVIISSSSSSYRLSGDFSVWGYRSFTLPLWPSISSPDSVVIISWSLSSSSSRCPSGDFSIWDYRSLTLPCGLVCLLWILSSSSLGLLQILILSFLLTCVTCT